MSKMNAIALAALFSFGAVSGAMAQGSAQHPGQPLGAEDRLGGAPEGQSGRSVGETNPNSMNRSERLGDHNSSGDMNRGEDSRDTH